MLKTFSILLLLAVSIYGNCYAQQSAKTSYGFVPGGTVVFEDDLSHDIEGKFPSKFRIGTLWGRISIPDSVRLCSVGQAYNNFINIITQEGEEVSIEPIITTKNYLGDNFTVEFDVLPGTQASCTKIEFIAPNKSLSAFATICGLTWVDSDDPDRETDFNNRGHTKYAPGFDYAAWHRFEISYNDRNIKCYLDHKLLSTIPDIQWPPNRILITSRGPLKIRKFRISNSTFNQLLTNDKLVTHAINFDANKSTIKSESLDFIAQLAQFLRTNPSIKLEIDGHTDTDGDAAINMELAKERADEVKKQLVSAGISRKRLTTKGFGASKPLQPNTTPEGKAANRRVEFIKI